VIAIARRLRCNVEADDDPRHHAWLATLPEQIGQLASRWSLVLGEPLLPGGQCAWVAPARDRMGRELVLKAGWRHSEAEHEGDALRLWDGSGAVRCLAEETFENTIALPLERCGGQILAHVRGRRQRVNGGSRPAQHRQNRDQCRVCTARDRRRGAPSNPRQHLHAAGQERAVTAGTSDSARGRRGIHNHDHEHHQAR
jgi:hypothetical protein